MKHKFWTAGALVISCGSFQACTQVPTVPPEVVECRVPDNLSRPGPALVGQTYGMSMTPLPLNSVQFGSTALARSIAVQASYATRTPTDSVRLQMRFVSCLDTPSSVRMRTSFLRSDTAPAEPPTPWKLVFLAPRATAVYEELSVSRDAASYLVEVTP